MHCNIVILCLHLNEECDSRFLFFSLPFFLHLANIIIAKGIGSMFPLKQLFWIVLVKEAPSLILEHLAVTNFPS